MKKWMLAALLCALLGLTGGCTAVDQAMDRLNEEADAQRLDTPQGVDSGIDWSFVPVVREMAVKTFAEGFPDALVKETSVATKNGDSARVVVTLTYEMNGKTGTYGFDYERNAEGEYVLSRYGDGVDSDDL